MYWHRRTDRCMCLSLIFHIACPYDIQMYQTGELVRTSLEALKNLEKMITQFLKRLDIYTQIPLKELEAMDNVIVEILVELVYTLKYLRQNPAGMSVLAYIPLD